MSTRNKNRNPPLAFGVSEGVAAAVAVVVDENKRNEPHTRVWSE